MAFDYSQFQRWSNGFDVGGNNIFAYKSTTQDIAAITASGYFDSVNGIVDGVTSNNIIEVNDLIFVNCTDYAAYVQVTDTSPAITTSQFEIAVGTGAVGTTNLADLAVTTAKIAANAVDTSKLSLDTIQYVKVPVTAAQFNGMYAAPFVMIAAPGANKMIVVKQAVLAMTFVSAQYAVGGNVALQYDTTVHGAGALASVVTANTVIQGYAASSSLAVAGDAASGASSAKVNKGIYLSNDTAAFTTGDGTWNVHIWYEVVTL